VCAATGIFDVLAYYSATPERTELCYERGTSVVALLYGRQGLEPEATHNESSPTYVENSVGLFDDGML